MKRIALVVLALTAPLLPQAASAQAHFDAVNYEMIQNGLFHPHVNNCNSSTEAFMALGSGGTSGPLGICVEKSERSALNWEDARLDCADEGKRLPELAEYRRACGLASTLSLSNMEDDGEWASNFPYIHSHSTSDGYSTGGGHWGGPLLGNGSCFHFGIGITGHSSAGAVAYPYRCVR